MSRDLVKYADRGQRILERHRHMDLKCDEIFDILKHCGVSASNADTAVGLLCYVYSIGTSVGYNARKREEKKA